MGERELRRKAEEALKENQTQMEKSRVDAVANSAQQEALVAYKDNSSNQKEEQLTLEVESLQKEKEALTKKLSDMEENNKVLEQKYLSNELKSREIDKELHFEAFLSMELARLRSGNSSSSGDVKNTATYSTELMSPDQRSNTSALI